MMVHINDAIVSAMGVNMHAILPAFPMVAVLLLRAAEVF